MEQGGTTGNEKSSISLRTNEKRKRVNYTHSFDKMKKSEEKKV